MLKRVLTILLVLFSQNVRANPCGTVRLDLPGQAFAKIPVYDQMKGESWDPNLCYAIVASQLRDAYRFAKGDPLDRLSAPLSIALNHKASVRQSGLDRRGFDTEHESDLVIGTGSPRAAILLNNDREVCDLHFLETYVSTRAGNDSPEARTVMSFLTYVTMQTDQYRKSDEDRARDESIIKLFTATSGCQRPQESNLERIFKVLDKSVPQARRPILDGQNFVHALCKGHSFKSTVPPAKLVDLKTQGQMQAELDRQLNAKVPIGIAYCHDYLKSPAKCPAGHTSVVIGREKKNGQCHYLVRDSYGKACHTRFKCEPDGSVWVPASELSATANHLFYIPQN